MSAEAIEEWLPVVGFPDYEVSSIGRVRRLTPGWHPNLPCPRMLTATSAHAGHLFHCLVAVPGTKPRRMLVHRMVAAAFIGPGEPGQFVAHGDGDPKNNRVDNLRWTDAKGNAADRDLHGRTRRGERHSQAKLTEDAVRAIRLRRGAGETGRALAREFGVGPTLISSIVHRRIWKEI